LVQLEVGITTATLSNTTTSSTNWQINVTLEPGDYQFFALAVDNSGNNAFDGAGLSVWPVNRSYSVVASDTTRPNITINPVADSAPGSITISGNSTDNQSIDRNRLLIRNTDTGLYWNGTAWVSSWSWFLTSGSENWQYQLSLSSGAYTATAWTWDTAGLRDVSDPVSFNIN